MERLYGSSGCELADLRSASHSVPSHQEEAIGDGIGELLVGKPTSPVHAFHKIRWLAGQCQKNVARGYGYIKIVTQFRRQTIMERSQQQACGIMAVMSGKNGGTAAIDRLDELNAQIGWVA